MDIKSLKDKILQLAIQGKLVPQNENDEPVSVLLEKIKQEKEQLIKDKVIKKEKPLTEITKEEQLFDLPKGWKWVKMGEIGIWGAGSTPLRGNSSYYNGNIPWIKTGELNDGDIYDSQEKITEIALRDSSLRLNPIGSVLIAMYGATIGKVGILQVEATTNQACCSCVTHSGVYNRYLFIVLLSMKSYFKGQSFGGAQPNISKQKIINTPIALPPLEEQKRIVAKVDEIFELIEALDNNKRDLLENISNSRNKILQLAIQGKLVEQCEEDEPASILLEKIKQEKEKLIKDKVIKKGKTLQKIKNEEKKFEIPNGWEWIRFSQIVNLLNGRAYKKTELLEVGETPVLRVGNFFTNQSWYYSDLKLEENKYCDNGDLLYAWSASFGPKIWNGDKVIYHYHIWKINIFGNINKEYLYYMLLNDVNEIKDITNGSTMVHVTKEKMENRVFPLPPLEEQKRIVAKIDLIMGYLDKLQQEIESQEIILEDILK